MINDGQEIIDNVIDDNELLLNDINLYFKYIDNIIHQQCIENGIDINSINSANFKFILSYIGDVIYKNNYMLVKCNNNICKYDVNKVAIAFKVLVRLCYKYGVDISKQSLALFIGCSVDVIYSWLKDDSIDFPKMIDNIREDILSSILLDPKRNPTSALAMLNHLYNWTSPLATRHENNVERISAKNMPKLSLRGEQYNKNYGTRLLFETDGNSENP